LFRKFAPDDVRFRLVRSYRHRNHTIPNSDKMKNTANRWSKMSINLIRMSYKMYQIIGRRQLKSNIRSVTFVYPGKMQRIAILATVMNFADLKKWITWICRVQNRIRNEEAYRSGSENLCPYPIKFINETWKLCAPRM
jgi:hypothetical protein